MSISTALTTTIAGLQNTETRISVLSENVTNAEKEGYTRKTIATDYVTINGSTVPVSSSIITSNYDKYMLESLMEDSSNAYYYSTTSEYMNNYTDSLGTVDSGSSLSAYTGNLAAALDELALTPEDSSLKSAVVVYANQLASSIQSTSDTIQNYRAQADKEIESVVATINSIVEKIDDLNKQVVIAETKGQSTATLNDERNTALQELSAYLDVNYFLNGNNEIQIYIGGQPLLDSRPRAIEYQAVSGLDATTLYPSGFAGIELNGYDLTTRLSTGKLAGLIQLRDEFFVEEQQKLDEFATTLAETVNTVLNTGTSLPSRPEIIGDTAGLTAATAFASSGTIRIATTDTDGVVQNYADIDLTTVTNVGDLVTAINAALGPDVTASLTADGELSLVANNAGEGISMNQMDSAIDSQTFSMYFGLNNLFSGTDASTIAVSDYLIDNANYLATGTMTDGALAVGDTVLFTGDGSIAATLNDAFSASVSFDAAGNFSARTGTLVSYVNAFISDAASRTSMETSNEETYTTLMEQTQASLQNLSGVNIDEELALLIDLQAKYEASATVISTIQELYDALMSAMR